MLYSGFNRIPLKYNKTTCEKIQDFNELHTIHFYLLLFGEQNLQLSFHTVNLSWEEPVICVKYGTISPTQTQRTPQLAFILDDIYLGLECH